MKEYRVWCGNYRHFIVEALNKLNAKQRFQKAFLENVLSTHGFSIKDITKLEKVEEGINETKI